MYYRTYSDLSKDVKSGFAILHPYHFDLVVGIPRSGMIPAYMISLGLNINCTTVQAYINNEELSHGSTRKAGNNLRFPREALNVLLVDDSIQSGSSLKETLNLLPAELRSKITTLVVYGVERVRPDVDIILKRVPLPRMFEWNIFHHSKLSEFCIDMDNIISLNPEGKYRPNDSLKLNSAFILPSNKVHSIVTDISEKYRNEIELWLRSHNIIFDNLKMFNEEDRIEVSKHNALSYHKAVYYKENNLILYLTNDPVQAKAICEIAMKPVYCVKNNIMYTPGKLRLLFNDPNYIPRECIKFLKQIKNFLKPHIKRVIPWKMADKIIISQRKT